MQEMDVDVDASANAAALFRFLEKECPQDVLPKILAYAGPRKAAALSKTNRFWKNVTGKEGTWRVMCEELYKVRLFRASFLRTVLVYWCIYCIYVLGSDITLFFSWCSLVSYVIHPVHLYRYNSFVGNGSSHVSFLARFYFFITISVSLYSGNSEIQNPRRGSSIIAVTHACR